MIIALRFKKISTFFEDICHAGFLGFLFYLQECFIDSLNTPDDLQQEQLYGSPSAFQ